MSGKPGRNEPCPCGSGKKYKKCCLGTERDAASAAERPTPTRAAADRRDLAVDEACAVCALNERLREIWQTGARLHNRRADRGQLPVLGQVAATYGYDYDDLDEAGGYFVAWLTFLGPARKRDQAALQAAIADELTPRARAVYDDLRRTLPQAWRIQRPLGRPEHRAMARGRPLVGPPSMRLEPVADVFGFDSLEYDEVYVGWPIVFGGKRLLVGTVAIEVECQEWIIDAARGKTPGSMAALWRALHDDVVAAALEPEYEPEYVYDQPAMTRFDPAQLRRWAAWRAEWYEGGILRVQAAQARSAADLAPFLESLGRLRARLLMDALRFGGFDGEADEVLPLADLVAHYGVGLDASVAGERLARFERGPARLLGLDPEALRRLGFDEHVPIGALASWCAAAPDGSERRELEAALERTRTEERWLATFDATDTIWDVQNPTPYYPALMRGFEALFEPALLATPLSEVPMPRGVLGRLNRALEADSGPRATTVDDLPRDLERLTALKGVGDATVEALVGGLLALARHWRYRQSGVDARRVTALEGLAPAARAELQGGLEELAALLG